MAAPPDFVLGAVMGGKGSILNGAMNCLRCHGMPAGKAAAAMPPQEPSPELGRHA